MGKHVNTRSVDRGGLVRRYATLRGITTEHAEKATRQWSRTELRDILEMAEREDSTVVGRHARWVRGQTTTVEGLTR